MIGATKGIVLQNVKYGDNQSIVRIFTEEYGKESYLVYATQNKRAAIRTAQLQPLTMLDLEVEHLPKRELQRIKEAKLHTISHSILSNPVKMAVCFFMAETIDKSLYAGEKDPALFGFIESYLEKLNASIRVEALFPIHFLLGMTQFLGFYPSDKSDNSFLINCPQETQQTLFLRLLNEETNFTRQERQELLHLLLQYYRSQLPGMSEIRSIDVLESLFDA